VVVTLVFESLANEYSIFGRSQVTTWVREDGRRVEFLRVEERGEREE